MATVQLSWTDVSNEEEFRVYRSTTGNPSFPNDYTQISTLGAGTTTYEDTNAPSGTVYYTVTAYNTAGESPETTNSIETVLPKTVDGDDVTEVTIDGDVVNSLTIDGDTVF